NKFRQQFGADYRSDLDLIFANPDGTPLKPDSVSAAVSLLCRRLGLPKGASLHTLRHSHGSFLLADGVDLATVSERLGQSSVRVTADIYSHALRGRDRRPPGAGTSSCGYTADRTTRLTRSCESGRCARVPGNVRRVPGTEGPSYGLPC